MSTPIYEFRDPIHSFIKLDSEERKVIDVRSVCGKRRSATPLPHARFLLSPLLRMGLLFLGHALCLSLGVDWRTVVRRSESLLHRLPRLRKRRVLADRLLPWTDAFGCRAGRSERDGRRIG